MELKKLEIPIDIDPGGTMPEIKADEHNLNVSFYLLDSTDRGNLNFKSVLQFTFGYPNEEALRGHRYSKLGLKPYDLFEIFGSEIIESIINSNKVHPYHKDSLFGGYRHFIIPFHDTTLEVIAKSYEFK